MKKYTVIASLTAAFLILAAVSLFIQLRSNTDFPLTVDIVVGDHTESIHCWTNENGHTYVFLPSYADITRTVIRIDTAESIRIDGKPVADGISCSAFQLNQPYEITYKAWDKTRIGTISFVQSANVAAMHIDTASGAMDYIHHEKGNEEAGKLRLYTADSELDYAGDIVAINGRGNASWTDHDKKPYSLELLNEADLLNMGAAQKWILLSNAFDPSNMRNKIVYDFADAVGLPYSPDSQWVDLYLNGEYAGLYLLCERNEIHPERVNISKDRSFLVSMEQEDRLLAQNYPYVSTVAEQALRIHYPKTTNETDRQKVLSVFQSIENAILAEDGYDSATGKHWSELIDLDSWVRKYLMEEIFANLDGCFISQYFSYDSNEDTGKVYAGPVWDFDKSLGTVIHWQLTRPDAFYANRLYVSDTDSTPWFHILYQKEEFYQQLEAIFQADFLPLLSELLTTKIEEYASQVSRTAEMNQKRWSMEHDLRWEVDYMTSFLAKRIEFLSSVWLHGKEYYTVQAIPGNNGHYAYFSVVPGECLTDLPVLKDTEYARFLGWYYADTNEPFDPTAPICEDIEIYAKWESIPPEKVSQVIKLIPLAVIAFFGVCLLTTELRRSRKGG